MVKVNFLSKLFMLILMITFVTANYAATVVGKVESVSKKAKVIQFINPKTKTRHVVNVDANTKYVDAKSLKDITKNTKIKLVLRIRKT